MTTYSDVLSIIIRSVIGMILLMEMTNATALLSSDSPSVQLPAIENTNISYSNMGVDFDWGKTIHAYDINYAIPIMTIIGFLPKIYEVYKIINSLLNPEAPKKTLEDVLEKVTEEFSEVKNQLKEIEKKLTQQEINVYHDVEVAVVGGINDIQFKSTINIESRAVDLYDQLVIFVNGMLGHSTVIPDLLTTLQSLYDCGSRRMYAMMERFITLLNVGAIGISYYSKVINNTDKFDGDLRIQNLSGKKDAILQRLQLAMKQCARLERPIVNEYISQVLTLMQTSSTVDVTRALYQRFDDIYYPLGISWVFYAAWEFHATKFDERVATHVQVQSAYMLCWQCNGVVGDVKKGGWSVYWTGEPRRNSPVGTIKGINTAAVKQIVDKQAGVHPFKRHALFIEQQLKPFNLVSSDSRYPTFWMIVVNPPSSATFGQPLDQPLNALSYRYTTSWKFFHEIIAGIPFWRSVTVDVVVL